MRGRLGFSSFGPEAAQQVALSPHSLVLSLTGSWAGASVRRCHWQAGPTCRRHGGIACGSARIRCGCGLCGRARGMRPGRWQRSSGAHRRQFGSGLRQARFQVSTTAQGALARGYRGFLVRGGGGTKQRDTARRRRGCDAGSAAAVCPDGARPPRASSPPPSLAPGLLVAATGDDSSVVHSGFWAELKEAAMMARQNLSTGGAGEKRFGCARGAWNSRSAAVWRFLGEAK